MMSIFVARDDLIFVGQKHGHDIVLPEKIKNLIKRYGAWYEGDGKDKIKSVSYIGSWDDKLANFVKGYPKEFLFVIFTNTDVNKQHKVLVGDGTIFDRILNAQKEFGYFRNKRFDANDLRAFLSSMGGNFLKRSKLQATPDNVISFIKDGEKEMWDSGNTSARKMADKANKYRDMWLLSRDKGVYFVGSDHIEELKKLMAYKKNNIEKVNVNSKNSKLI